MSENTACEPLSFLPMRPRKGWCTMLRCELAQTATRAVNCAKPHIKLELVLASEPQQPENSHPMPRRSS